MNHRAMPKKRSRQNARNDRIIYAQLESRTLLALTTSLSFNLQQGFSELTITGDSADDAIVLTNTPTTGIVINGTPLFSSTPPNIGKIIINSGAGRDAITIDQRPGNFDFLGRFGATREIKFSINGQSGFDQLNIFGTNAVDIIHLGTLGINLNDDIEGNITLVGIELTTIDAQGGDDIVSAGNGNFEVGTAFARNVRLLGGPGNDTLSGGLKNDSLFGGSGKDILFGDKGNDLLDGGDGGDTLNGNDGNDRLFGRQGNDVLVGGRGDDQLDGGENNDILRGDQENDVLDGGDGADSLNGGDGDDILRGGNGNDVLADELGNNLFFGGAGSDTLNFTTNKTFGLLIQVVTNVDDFAMQSFERARLSLVNRIQAKEIEILNTNGGVAADVIDLSNLTLPFLNSFGIIKSTISGGSGGDEITGTAIRDTIHGDEGDDKIIGGPGPNILFGDDGDDLLIGNSSNDEMHGGNGNDDLRGAAGNDLMFGDEGNDKLDGDVGADVLHGGNDNDELIGDDGNDQLFGEDGDDKILDGRGLDHLVGGNGQDILEASNDNEPDLVEGGAGNDSMRIFPLDILDGGIGGVDKAFFSGFIEPRTITADRDNATNELIVSIQFPNTSGLARVSNIEELLLEGGINDDLIDLTALSAFDISQLAIKVTVQGREGNDTIKGSGGNDIIIGGEGDDVLLGGSGDDLIFGSAGSDTIAGGAGNDRLFGQSGDDLINGGDGDDEIHGDDGVNSANGGNDTLNGGTGNDKIFGEKGDDTINGNAGNDDLFGGAGNDVINGNDGDDNLFGEEGDDLLNGGTGNNTFDEGPGNGGIVLVGTRGDDVFRIGRQVVGNNVYVVTKFNGQVSKQFYRNGETVIVFAGDGDDRVVMESNASNPWVAEFHGGSGNDLLVGGKSDDLLVGDEGDDRLFGNQGNDVLVGSAGEDWLFGGQGLDILIGGQGIDWLFGQSNDDLLIGGSTAFDQQVAAWRSIQALWNSNLSYLSRALTIQTSSFYSLRKEVTVWDDLTVDHMLGQSGRDLFFGGLGDAFPGRINGEQLG